MKKYTYLILLSVALLSCSKDEGYGGLATIKGKVYGKDYNSSGYLVGEGYLGDVSVYISASGSTDYFDKVQFLFPNDIGAEYEVSGNYFLQQSDITTDGKHFLFNLSMNKSTEKPLHHLDYDHVVKGFSAYT